MDVDKMVSKDDENEALCLVMRWATNNIVMSNGGEVFGLSISETFIGPNQTAVRLQCDSGDSMSFSTEWRAHNWRHMLEVLANDLDGEGLCYTNRWGEDETDPFEIDC